MVIFAEFPGRVLDTRSQCQPLWATMTRSAGTLAGIGKVCPA